MGTSQFAALLPQFTRIAEAIELLAGAQADGLIENLFRGGKSVPGGQLSLPLVAESPGRAGFNFQTAEIIMTNSADVDQAAAIMRGRHSWRG